MKKRTETIVLLLVSFAAFAAGVWALYADRTAVWRPWVLRASFGVLLLAALRRAMILLKR